MVNRNFCGFIFIITLFFIMKPIFAGFDIEVINSLEDEDCEVIIFLMQKGLMRCMDE